jgi:hypothetical protein
VCDISDAGKLLLSVLDRWELIIATTKHLELRKFIKEIKIFSVKFVTEVASVIIGLR